MNETIEGKFTITISKEVPYTDTSGTARVTNSTMYEQKIDGVLYIKDIINAVNQFNKPAS